MRTTTLGDHMEMLLRQTMSSDILKETARGWLETDSLFTRWIHEYAKKQLGDEGMLQLAESEDMLGGRAMAAWSAYASSHSQASESTLVEVLRDMILFRKQSMGSSAVS